MTQCFFFTPGISEQVPFQYPTWSLDFTTGSLPAGATLTRSGTAPYYNSAGTLTFAPTNTARFDYDPVALTTKGLLYENVIGTNFYLNSNTGTGLTFTGITSAGNTVTGPDGVVNSAWFMREDGTTGFHNAFRSSVAKDSLTQHSTTSVYFKNQSGTRGLQFFVGTSTGSAGASMTINPATGALINSGTFGSGWSKLSAKIETCSNGWFRATISVLTDTGDFRPQLYMTQTVGGTNSYTGDGASGIAFYGLDIKFSVMYPLVNGVVKTTGTVATQNKENLKITVPTDMNLIVATFDDGSQSTFVATNGSFLMPPLPRPWLTLLQGYPYVNPVTQPTLASANGFNTTVFYDDYTNPNTVDSNNTHNPSYKNFVTQVPFHGQTPGAGPASDFLVANSTLTLMGQTSVSPFTQDNVGTICYLGYTGQRWLGQCFSPQNGMYLECRASVPNITAIAPAFGTPGICALYDLQAVYMSQADINGSTTAAATGGGVEIDTVEYLSAGGGVVQTNVHEWFGSTFATDNTNGASSQGSNANMHVYGMLWNTAAANGGTGSIQFYFDGTLITTVTYSATAPATPGMTPTNPNGALFTAEQSSMMVFSHAACANAAKTLQIPIVIDYIQIWQ